MVAVKDKNNHLYGIIMTAMEIRIEKQVKKEEILKVFREAIEKAKSSKDNTPISFNMDAGEKLIITFPNVIE